MSRQRNPLHWQSEFRRLAVINVLSNLTVPMAGLADTAMLGRLPGAVDLAGVALATLLFDLLYFGAGFLRMGTTGPVAQAHGRGDEASQVRVLLQSASLAVVLGVAIVALQAPLARGTFALLSGSAPVEAAGAAYLHARIWAAPATLLNLVLLGWFLGRGESGRALAVTVVQNAMNIVFNALFILVLGMGASGAGWATAIGQYAGLALALRLLTGQVPTAAIRSLRFLQLRSWREMLALNRDIFVRTMCLLAAFTLFTEFSARLGTLTLAANAVLLRAVSVGSYWIDGLAYATETLVGRFRGAGDIDNERRVLSLALLWSLGIALVIAVPAGVWPDPLLTWMVSDVDVQNTITRFSLWLVPVLALGAAAYIFDGFFLGRSAGPELRNSMIVSLVVFLPAALLAVGERSAHLLWFAMTLLMTARAATLLRALRLQR